MKIFNVALMIALFAVAGAVHVNAVQASTYEYNLYAQEEVVVGEDAVPAPSVESYGVMPSWGNGCCDRQPGKADHLWDNYCFERHSGCRPWHCCGKAYCGSGPFSKGCCKSKGCRKISLPKLNVWNKCCQKASCCKSKVHGCSQKLRRPGILGHCCGKAKTCGSKAKGCVKQAHCRKPILSKLRLFGGCHGAKRHKGKGGAAVDSGCGVNELPAPAIEGDVIEMPNEVPVPPMVDPAA